MDDGWIPPDATSFTRGLIKAFGCESVNDVANLFATAAEAEESFNWLQGGAEAMPHSLGGMEAMPSSLDQYVFSEVFKRGYATLWPRQRLIDKVEGLRDRCLEENRCFPGTASKLEGCLNFLSSGMYGRVGRGGMPAIRARAHSKFSTAALTPRLEQFFHYLPLLLKATMEREFPVRPRCSTPLVVATDASAEPGSPVGLGALCIGPASGARFGYVAQLADVRAMGWQECENPICIAEAAAPLFTLLASLETFAGRDVVWYVDNTPAVCSYVKGSASSLDIERAVHVFYLIRALIKCRIWWEWVESDANWSDGVSRLGLGDPFARRHGFSLSTFVCPSWPWRLPLQEVFHRVVALCEQVYSDGGGSDVGQG